MELPVVNHPDYEAQIGENNKFPIKKFGELAKYLKKEKIVSEFKPASHITAIPLPAIKIDVPRSGCLITR